MCGIVGYIGKRDATPVLLEGLHRLEYRGYDSAGLAVVRRGRLQITKTAGRVQDLRDKLDDGKQATKATIGIGHTRWATHGEPNERNAHPHTDTEQRIALVHNGIIENADQLRDQLTAAGVTLVSDTDTEALAHMIAAELAATESASLSKTRSSAPCAASRAPTASSCSTLKNPDELVVARKGSPIVLGLGENEMFVASDVAALVRYTRQVIYLEDGEVATIRATDYRTTTLTGPVSDDGHRTPTTVDAHAEDYELGAVQRLHAQGDPRAAGRDPPGGHGPPGRAVRHREARRPQPRRRASCATSSGSSSSAAAAPTTRARWAPRSSRNSRASPPTPSPRASSGTAARSWTRTRSTSPSPSRARRATR